MSTTELNEQLFFDVQQKTDKQHILDNPDTYIGSVENAETEDWVMSDDNDKIIHKQFNYIPGLFKLFDEGIVNCRDHVVRMKTKVESNIENALPVTHIDITIENDGTITMLNDGNGIDVAQKDGIWLPELVFAHLRTSTNYNKDEKKIVGGKNGFGFKLVLIWSTYGRIETVDHIRGFKYIQEYKNNLDEICTPLITKCKNKPYTKITFKPDYARLGIDGLSPDMMSLLKKRVYDISAITDKNIKVKYNNEIIPIKNFEQYINMYIGDKSKNPRVYEENNDRWEYCIAMTDAFRFKQISFVNGIYTSKGGKHVEYIMNQICKKFAAFIQKKKKIEVSASTIQSRIMLFLRCDIENPAFDSQTKDYMNTPSSKFGSKCEVSDKFIEKIAKIGLMEEVLSFTQFKDNKAAKKNDGKKCEKIRGVPKLTDANWAGTSESRLCTLILCEGESAKAGVLSGLSSEDRNIFGVYPLKGKLLNVRGELVKKIANNTEITEIKQILGLVNGQKYLNADDVFVNLRYSRVLFMTDQDLDGSHIKGLCINLFACEWPSLLEIPGFIGFMNTPILKAKKSNNELNFYNQGEFDEWKQNTDTKGWNIKYYKGLGTSTGKEFKEYFQDKKVVEFKFNGKESEDAIDKVFNDKRADDRKEWLKEYDRYSYIDTSKQVISYEEFINKEVIHFSKYDCDRSIPNLIDGLKISQRKILFSAFKRNLINEIKVAQFAGYVSEHSGYHHGEDSLHAAIIGMAQNFVGSNNISLFNPNGQFGTRLKGGKDHSAERYIFTRLSKITKTIFSSEDEPILQHLYNDESLVEPVYYAPIIPMIIVNGTKGIGTGFSSEIMCYNPLQIIEYLQNKLKYIENNIEFVPYYEGFKGQITKISDSKFLIRGIYEKTGPDTINVTELPVGYWTQDFKEHIEYWCNPGEDKDKNKIQPIIKDFQELWTDSEVLCKITFVKGKLTELENAKGEYGCNGLEKFLKLYTTKSTTNMHLFDANDKLQKYEKISDIIDAYFDVRLQMYETRKLHMVQKLERELLLLSNKARYIQEELDGTIDLRRKTKEQVRLMMQNKGYDIIDNDPDYKYLVKMSMDSVTEELVNELHKQHSNKIVELNTIKNITANQFWLDELNKLIIEYNNYKLDLCKQTNKISVNESSTKKKIVKKNVKKQSLVIE
jgi:DNA topoisomerase-2